MIKLFKFHNSLAIMIAAATCMAAMLPATAGPIKVYILAGQSNMQGHANISTVDSMADDPITAPILKEMRQPDGSFKTCQKVWIASVGCAGNGYSDVIEQKGKLTAGFGASPSEIGPEYTFGLYMEKLTHEPILIIKTSWGGRNLHTDFRPPSAGPEQIGDYMLEQWRQRKLNADEETAKIRNNGSVFYREMITYVKKVLADIPRVMPGYDPKLGYKLAGFVWFQGFNDLVDDWTYHDRRKPGGYDEYARLMTMLIKDVRKDLSVPDLPVVVGVMGIGGLKEDQRPPQCYFRQAQAAPATLREFKGRVKAVQTARFWDDDLEALQARMDRFNDSMNREFKKDPALTREARDAKYSKAKSEAFPPEELKRLKGISNGGYHYMGAAKILAPIGKAFAEGMLELQKHKR